MSTAPHRYLTIALTAALAATCTFTTTANASTLSDSVPQLSSRPGAAYTLYLDPSGFAYDGTWLGSTPGTNLGFRNAPPGDTFNASDLVAIRAMWAATANQFRSFDVNVTTVDPAVAAGQDADDIERKDYYDSQTKMMHTVIGPPGNAGWQGAADGIAALGVIDIVAPSNGEHTNWMFSQDVNNGDDVLDGNYIGTITSHEVGHTFGLQHQGDFTAGASVNEYGFGDTAAGDGSYVAIMGNASGRQRAAWRVGSAHDDSNVTFTQNDVAVIMANDGMTIVDSGIGHSFATATPIPVTGGIVDVNDPLHRGTISPVDSGGGYDPIGFANYTFDFFSFQADGINPVTLTVNNGNDLLVPGTADNGFTLRAFLDIYDDGFTPIATGTEDPSTLFTSYTATPAAGTYYAQITSWGGHDEVSGFDPAQYYDMGGYFLTGSGFVIPEPGTFAIILFTFAVAAPTRRRRAA